MLVGGKYKQSWLTQAHIMNQKPINKYMCSVQFYQSFEGNAVPQFRGKHREQTELEGAKTGEI